MDTINIPTINKGAMQSSLGVAVANIYKNADALEYKTFITAQNRQFTTYGLVGIRKSLIDDLKSLCSSYQIGVSNITFSANAAANAAFVLNPKLKNTSFILLDIKERSARFSIIIKGRTMGYYSLPFGYSILSKTHLTAEDLLFDHAAAELLILNAKEKAKAKHFTVSEDTENIGSPDLSDDESAGDGENTLETEDEDFEIKYSAESNKRSARKLPKFMLRDVPTTSEACVYENFRIFMKWTIDLYNNNASLINLGGADTVYVNMPDENTFLYPMINAEVAENKLKFMPLIESTDQDSYAKDLELFGGLYVKQYNKVNNF